MSGEALAGIRLAILCLASSALLATPAPARPAAPGDVVVDRPGTIVRVSGGWIGIVPDDDPGTRYAPGELPAEFRRDGLRVVLGRRRALPRAGEELGAGGGQQVVAAKRRVVLDLGEDGEAGRGAGEPGDRHRPVQGHHG